MNAKHIILSSRPVGLPVKETFVIETTTLPALKEHDVKLKSLYVSVDPYMRERMNDVKSYAPPYQVGAPIVGGVVAEVVESNSPGLHKGDLVFGMLPWATVSVVAASHVKKIDKSLAPPTYFLGILGMPGLTAYFGLLYIGQPKPGETVVISGAAGAVGIVAGQIAKLKGCRVVGIAGSDEKIRILKEQFHFDEGINYKSTKDLVAALKKACPDDVDIYFDNVGGEISDAVISRINFHARIVLCGQISLYNSKSMPTGPRPQPMLLTRSALMQGFIVSNYQNDFSEGLQQLSQWVKEGKLTYKETIIEGFDQLPDALLGLFSGDNTGKMIVKV
jgi:NADPH:quinone reductase